MRRSTPRAESTRLLGLFAVPLGLAGVGGVWRAGHMTLSAPGWPATGLMTAFVLALTAASAVDRVRSRDRGLGSADP